jgi:hypothetical protein
MSRIDDPRKLMRGEIALTQWRYDELMAKERAHDAYLTATRLMSQRVRGYAGSNIGDEWYAGYRDSLRDFARLVVDQASMREALA